MSLARGGFAADAGNSASEQLSREPGGRELPGPGRDRPAGMEMQPNDTLPWCRFSACPEAEATASEARDRIPPGRRGREDRQSEYRQKPEKGVQ